jgi:hypothetical protein
MVMERLVKVCAVEMKGHPAVSKVVASNPTTSSSRGLMESFNAQGDSEAVKADVRRRMCPPKLHAEPGTDLP